MTKIAFLFPGQGSQQVGMGESLLKGNYADFYTNASEWLGFDLKKLMLEGPKEALTLTYHAQPALVATGALIATRLIDEGIQPQYTAGHSLGEYTALVASGVLTLEDAVKAVHKRGLFMNEAVPAGEGAMAAILALDETTLLEVVKKASEETGEIVQLANLNCPGQIVISGTKKAVECACSRAKEAGARKAILLNVSGPFHSALMQPAAVELASMLRQIDFKQATIPVIANVTASAVSNPTDIERLLVEQVTAPVRFEESVRELIQSGVDTFIECGPGKVLSGLVKKINRDVTVYSVYDDASLEEVCRHAKEWSYA